MIELNPSFQNVSKAWRLRSSAAIYIRKGLEALQNELDDVAMNLFILGIEELNPNYLKQYIDKKYYSDSSCDISKSKVVAKGKCMLCGKKMTNLSSDGIFFCEKCQKKIINWKKQHDNKI